MSKRRPVLIASLPSKRVVTYLPEPTVKKVKVDAEVSSEEQSDEEFESKLEQHENKNALPKPAAEQTVFSIPTSKELLRKRQEALNLEKIDFVKYLIHNFERNERAGGNSFVVCYDIQYKWQHVCLEKLFKSKGYDITYKNERDNDGDRTFAEIRIPGGDDSKEPFRV